MKRYEKTDDSSYCLGMSLTIEALKHLDKEMIEVIVSDKANRNGQFGYLLSLCEEKNVSVRYDERAIERLSVKENCYCIGVFKKFERPLFGDMHILLYGFDDFGELGTVLRSAICFDFKDIVLLNSDIDCFDPRCIRASMGSIFHCNIGSYQDLDGYLKDHPKQKIVPFTSKGSIYLSDYSFERPYSLLIPQDPKGLDDLFENGVVLEKTGTREMSLSIRSSIILQCAYEEKRRRY